jgi:CHAT domain-containing protein/tetratricopeptide (TPR) repeat protein
MAARSFALSLVFLSWLSTAAEPPLTAEQQAQLTERRELVGRVEALKTEGKYDAALAPERKILELTRMLRGPEHAEVADALERLASLQELAGQLDAAVKVRKDALALREKLDGDQHWRTADARLALELTRKVAGLAPADRVEVVAALRQEQQARTLWQKDKGMEAERAATAALMAYRKHLEDGIAAARALELLGIARWKQGDLKRAQEAIEQALAIQRKVLPPGHPDIAHSLYCSGLVQGGLRDYVAARRSYEEALAIYRKARPKDHLDIAESLYNLGIVQADLRDYVAARRSYEEALAIHRKALPKDHPDIAKNLNNLGVMQQELRDYAAARKNHEEALAIRRKVLPKDHPDMAISLNNLGNVQRQLRDYAAARRSHEEALAIRRQALSKDDPDIATSLNNLGHVQSDLREYAAARRSLEEALAISRKALPKDHPLIAGSLSNLGVVQRQLRDYAAARRSYEEALAIKRKALPKDHPDIAISLENLGIVQSKLREYAAARRSLEEALAIHRKALPKDHPDIATSLNNLGVVQQELRDYAAARRSYEEALAIKRKALPKDHPDIAQGLHNLGVLCLESGDDRQTALPLVAEAATIFQRDLSHLALAQAEAEQFHAAAELRISLDLLLSLAPPPEPHPGNDRYAAVVGFKGAVTARQRWARRGRELADAEAARLLRQLQQANSQLLAAALSDLPGVRAEDLRELSERRARLERELAALSPSYRRFLEQGRRSPADLRAMLPARTALLDCVHYWHISAPARGEHDLQYEPRLVVFVVRPDRAGVVEVPLGPSERIADLIDRWRASHGRGKTPPADQPDPATELRKLLWEPLEKHLEGVKVVLVSPDGPLNGLPLAALPGREPGKFLVHQYAFAIVPVPQLLPDLLAEKPRQADGPAALVVGDVDFDAAAGAAGVAAAGDRLPPLPGTREEARAVYELFGKTFPGRPAELLTGNAATKVAFVARVSGRSHLLLATHGFFVPEPRPKEDSERGLLRSLRSPLLEPGVAAGYPALRSGLAFAGANRSALGKGDGFLTALEASELDLDRVELAVLSACETGLGKAHGGEGVLGLQRAFQLAGARTAVTSLWKVPDAATQALMTRIHRNLWEKRLGKGEALREAQLWLLQEGGKHPELLRGGLEPPERPKGEGPVSPFYWAAFVLSGDWR